MTAPRTALLALLPLALTACSASDASTDEAAEVPDGVAAQYATLAEEVEEKGRTATSGEWTVHLVTEAAEPWHEVAEDGTTRFRDVAAGETDHVEIIPVETATGRIVPDVPITIEVVGADGEVVSSAELEWFWSRFSHYAANLSVPQGDYELRATLGTPTFHRHGDADEVPALAEGATVTFDDVALGGA